jgi:predicted ATPase
VFTRIHTRHFRCLRTIDQRLGSFQALVGPNASGKTSFLEVLGLLSDLVRNRGDVVSSVQSRSANFADLLWMGTGNSFQLAVEVAIPEAVQSRMAADMRAFTEARYEIEIGLDPKSNEIGLNHEAFWLRHPEKIIAPVERDFFPHVLTEPKTILSTTRKNFRAAFKKQPGGNDNYYPEGKQSYKPSFPLGRTKAAIANIPGDADSFPVSTWFRTLLEKGVQTIVLNSQIIRQPSPPGLGRRFLTDGSNLPWVVEELRKDKMRFAAWLDHVRTALEDIRDVTTVERGEDKHRYLVVEYASGAKVPSWLVSDGTLRLLALTIPAYLSDMDGVFLIEEPENGIHPRAIETVLQSLTSIYGSQVLMATHSPVALNMLEPAQVLCFAKDSSGATDIVSGDLHPALREWKQGQPDLGILFASGILS